MLPCDAGPLVPHQPPMRMVDRLLWATPNGAGAEFTLTPACSLLDDKNSILPVGLIEVAAQACAAWQGFAAVSKQAPIRQGYLVGVDRFKYLLPAHVGQQLITTLCLAADLDNFMAVDAQVKNTGGDKLASLRLKVFALPGI